MNLIKSFLHNSGVLVVSFAFALIGVGLDYLFGIARFYSPLAIAAGSLLLAAGFLLRVWATYHFYQQNMKVIVLHTQQSLITGGPYRLSRHPLYLGGNVFMFLGATLLLGTPSGVVLTIAHLPIMDWMIAAKKTSLRKSLAKNGFDMRRKCAGGSERVQLLEQPSPRACVTRFLAVLGVTLDGKARRNKRNRCCALVSVSVTRVNWGTVAIQAIRGTFRFVASRRINQVIEISIM